MKEFDIQNGEEGKNLSTRDFLIGGILLAEGLNYDEIRKQAQRVGQHTSFMLHESQEIISIHFREGMDELKKMSDKPITLMRNFLKNLKGDLGELASLLKDQAELSGVREIWGLCALSPRWGERHGFKTKVFVKDPKIVQRHESSITGKPSVGELAVDQPLHLFIHSKDSFIKVFGNGS